MAEKSKKEKTPSKSPQKEAPRDKSNDKSKARSTGQKASPVDPKANLSGTKQAASIKQYLPDRPGGGTEDKKSHTTQGRGC